MKAKAQMFLSRRRYRRQKQVAKHLPDREGESPHVGDGETDPFAGHFLADGAGMNFSGPADSFDNG
jgi:hypothetical protein